MGSLLLTTRIARRPKDRRLPTGRTVLDVLRDVRFWHVLALAFLDWRRLLDLPLAWVYARGHVNSRVRTKHLHVVLGFGRAQATSAYAPRTIISALD